MTKNYFTDEQLNAIHKEICRLEDLESGTSLPVHPLNNVETANLRRICNLAVEAAIGQPVASQVPRLIDLSKSTNVHFSRTKEGMHLTDDELKESINGTVANSLFPLYEAGYYVEDKHNVKHYSIPLYSVKELEN